MLGEKEEGENTSEGLRFGISLHLAFEAYNSKRTKFKKKQINHTAFCGFISSHGHFLSLFQSLTQWHEKKEKSKR